MSNQIAVLGTTPNTADGSFAVQGVFWLTVPAANVVPLPNFVSRVPFVDQATLMALRSGTLVEQSWTTPLFAAGTTLAAVQAQLVTNFTAAQIAVTSAASPLSGLVATEYTGASWTPVFSAPVFDPVPKFHVDVAWAASAGLIPGIASGCATGYCATAAASLVPVNATTYTPLGGAGAQISFASTSANDAAAGTGAQQITVQYLDAAFVLHTEVVTLNGVTPVNTVGTNYAYLESIVVTSVGTSGGTNAGVVQAFTQTAGGGSVWGSIAAPGGVGDGKTFWSHHYVPAGVTCYLLSFEGASSAVQQTLVLLHMGNPSANNLPKLQLGPTVITPAAGDYREHDFLSAVAVPGPDLIQAFTRPFAATASTSFANFEYLQY